MRTDPTCESRVVCISERADAEDVVVETNAASLGKCRSRSLPLTVILPLVSKSGRCERTCAPACITSSVADELSSSSSSSADEKLVARDGDERLSCR